MKIGWASRDVTTNERVTIVGQISERISTGPIDPTTVTVLTMDDGKDSVIFISGDFTNISCELVNELKDALSKKRPEIDTSKIIFNGTHTHSSPRYLTVGKRAYDMAPRDERLGLYPPEKYRAFLVESVCDAVIEAYDNKEEGSFSYGYSNAAIGRQRRVTYFNDRSVGNTSKDTFAVNGFGAMYGKTNVDDFSGFESASDTKAYFVFTFDKNEKLTGAIVNVPCPSQCTENDNFTSADFWHETRTAIREKYGDIYILPQCAAAGDQSPHVIHCMDEFYRRCKLKYGEHPEYFEYKKPWEFYNRKAIAEIILTAFDDCYEWASKEKISDAPIVHETKKVSLDAWKISKEEYEKMKANYEECANQEYVCTDDPEDDFAKNTALSANILRYKGVIDKYESDKKYFDTTLHVLKIGDIAFASNPFELYTDYQHRIQARSPFVQTFIVQLAAQEVKDSAEVAGYLATERGVFNRGYSAIAFSCNVTPAGGQTLVEETLKILNDIK